jgi:superoxide reductase
LRAAHENDSVTPSSPVKKESRMKPTSPALRRREFAKVAFLGAAAASLPAAANAQGMMMGSMANKNVIFTKEDPAHWAGKEALHVPVATVSGSTLSVKTPHPMSDAHFIVSHSVILGDGTYLSRAVFTPKDQPVSTHTLPAGYKGRVTVTSTCNLHDFWATTITV